MNSCEVKAHLIGCWQYLGAVCFWQPIPFELNVVVVAVLRDSLYRVIAALRGRMLCCIISCVRLSGLSYNQLKIITIITETYRPLGRNVDTQDRDACPGL